MKLVIVEVEKKGVMKFDKIFMVGGFIRMF